MSEAEQAQILAVANEPRFAALPPARIVPMLADEGVYLASESSFQRVLRAHGQNRHRARSRAPQASRQPSTHIATAPGEVWCWDMTYLPAQVKGQWLYLYLILDLYSRKIVGWEVHARDDADHAARLVKRTALSEGVHAMANKPVLHGDNGSTLKATSVLAMLHWLDGARAWACDFVDWYNFEHRHSGIRYVSPAQRHEGEDRAILAARHETYRLARQRNPLRWSRGTRNWTPIGVVTLNPERDGVVHATARAETKARSAA